MFDLPQEFDARRNVVLNFVIRQLKKNDRRRRDESVRRRSRQRSVFRRSRADHAAGGAVLHQLCQQVSLGTDEESSCRAEWSARGNVARGEECLEYSYESFVMTNRNFRLGCDVCWKKKTKKTNLFSLHPRVTDVCFKKCVAKFHEGDLNTGEQACVDRCVSKYFDVS